jgi:hypothetical protein
VKDFAGPTQVVPPPDPLLPDPSSFSLPDLLQENKKKQTATTEIIFFIENYHLIIHNKETF